MQYSWGNNVDIQLIKEVADNVAGHGGVVINAAIATKMGIENGDLLRSLRPSGNPRPCCAARGYPARHAVNGWSVRSLVDAWPSSSTCHLEQLMPMLFDLTDATGSSADLVKASVTLIEKTA